MAGILYLSFIALADLEFRNLLQGGLELWPSFHSPPSVGITGNCYQELVTPQRACDSIAQPALRPTGWSSPLLESSSSSVPSGVSGFFSTLISCFHFMLLWLDINVPQSLSTCFQVNGYLGNCERAGKWGQAGRKELTSRGPSPL